MLNEILNDNVTIIPAENQPLFDLNFDYAAEQQKRQVAIENWKKLEEAEKANFNNDLESFVATKGIRDLKAPELIPAKNWSILVREIEVRVREQNILELLPINDLHFEQSLIEIVENIENVEHVKDLYKLRKRLLALARTRE